MTYFVSIQDILTNNEMERLRETSMFFAVPGSAMAPKRYLPNQLHKPSSENISLGLPVLDWGGSIWDPKSPEVQFAFSPKELLRHSIMVLTLPKHPSVDI